MPQPAQINPAIGRPRPIETEEAILDAALSIFGEKAISEISLSSIAEKANISRPTIYRRWPNKTILLLDAFLDAYGRQAAYARGESALESLLTHYKSEALALQGKGGELLISLMAEALFDPELKLALQSKYFAPREQAAAVKFAEAMINGEVHSQMDIDRAIDILNCVLYFGIQKQAALGANYIDDIFAIVINGFRIQRRANSI